MSEDESEKLVLTRKGSLEELPNRWISERYKLSYLGFVGFFLVYSMRVNMSVAIVDMVNTTVSASNNSDSCPLRTNETSTNNGGEFNWSSGQESLVLSAFFYGYMFSQFLGGYSATRLGGKWVYGFGVLLPGLLTLLTPPVAYVGVWYLIALRAVMGFCEGVTYPSFSVLQGLWVPSAERSLLWSVATSGGLFGNVVTQPFVGYLCSLPLWRGWPLGFYITGFLTLLWFGVWVYVAYDTPAKHPRISIAERNLILENTRVERKIPPVPWMEIFTSRAWIALFPAHFACLWVTFGIMTCLPLYLSNVQNFDIAANGTISALPWVCNFLFTIFAGFMSDWIRARGFMTTTWVRKMNQFISTFFPGLFLLLAGFAGCNSVLAVSYIVLAMSFAGFSTNAVLNNHLDISHLYSGIIFGVDNTGGAASGVVAPLVVGALTSSDPTSAVAWQHVFYVFAAVSWFGGAWFIALGTGEPQPWGAEQLEEVKPLLIPGPVNDKLSDSDDQEH